MGAFIPFLVWLISAFICHLIAKKRNVKVSTLFITLVVILGPLAIPLVYLFKPES
jgi:hypothetical protein